MIVVDAGVIAALVLSTSDTGLARNAFLRDHDWASPPLWKSDLRGTLYRQIRAGAITKQQAAQAFEAASTVIADNTLEPATLSVLALALSLGLDLYDAEFVALAKDLGVSLVTSDEELAAAVPDHVRTLQSFVA